MVDAHILDGDLVILEDRKDVRKRRHRRGAHRWGDHLEELRNGNWAGLTSKRRTRSTPDLGPARELTIQGVMISLNLKTAGDATQEALTIVVTHPRVLHAHLSSRAQRGTHSRSFDYTE